MQSETNTHLEQTPLQTEENVGLKPDATIELLTDTVELHRESDGLTSSPTGDLEPSVPPISPTGKDKKSDPEALVGNIIDEKYRVLKLIGRGGASVIYLGVMEQTNKQCVIKVVDKTVPHSQLIVDSHKHETYMMMQFDHPAIPKVFALVEDEQNVYIIREYIFGESLNLVIKERGAIPGDTAIEWAIQLCDALHHLHTHNPPYIYRDMKPGNIMLQPDGNLKLIDFGIAMMYDPLKEDVAIVGTRGYAAPEQYAGKSDCRSDIFGLGMTLHYIVTGVDPCQPPYDAMPIRNIKPELSVRLESIIARCIEPNPEKRFQTAKALKNALLGNDSVEPTKSFWSNFFGKK